MKKITLLVISLLLSLLLFGCGKQSDNTPETKAPETTGEKLVETTALDTTGNNSSGTESPETNAPETTTPDTKETPSTGKPDTDYSDHEFYIDVNFDSKLDKLVPHERSAYAVFYKAYIWNEAKGDYIYAPSFELFPNVSIDTERKVLLAYKSGGMITSYSMFTYNGEDFETIRSIYWENTGADSKIHFVVEESGNKVLDVNVKQADIITPDKTDEQIKGYFESGSIWDLDGARWKNYIFNMDNSDWWKF